MAFAKFIRSLGDPLLRNASVLTFTTLVNMGAGFMFWLISARLCADEDVGVASSIVSIMSLVVLLSRLGLDYALVRYYPECEKNTAFGTTLSVVTVATLVFACMFLALLGGVIPGLELLLLPFTVALFFVSVLTWSWVSLLSTLFVASRQPNKYLAQTAFVGSRCLIVIPLMSFAVTGILAAVALSYLLALFVSVYFLIRMKIVPVFTISRQYLAKALNFSMANYVGSLLVLGSVLIMPTIVLDVMGAQEAAYYFVAYSVMSLLLVIPNAIGASLFVEGSYGRRLGLLVKRVVPLLAIVTLLPALCVYAFSAEILGLFGSVYSGNASELLRILAVSSLLICIVYLYFAVCRVRKDSKSLLIISGVTSVSLLALSYSLADSYGLAGIGYAWLISHIIACITTLLVEYSRRRGQRRLASELFVESQPRTVN